MQGLFISGSGTNIGKTFIAQQIIKLLNKKHLVSVRKPVESDCRSINGKLIAKDAMLLSKACNTDESMDIVCPFKFEACVSGEKASVDSKINLNLNDLVKPCQVDNFVVIEGAGGLLSPICKNTLNIDLIEALNLPIIIVVKDDLGAVNQALLSDHTAKNKNLDVKAIVLNQFSSNTLDNAEAVRQYTSTPVVVFNQTNIADFSNKILNLLT